jgi:hypothetical protein
VPRPPEPSPVACRALICRRRRHSPITTTQAPESPSDERSNIKQVPLLFRARPTPRVNPADSYIAAAARGTALAPRCRLDVQQQVLALPGTDDLREGLVLGFLDGGIGQHEAIAEQIHQRLGFAQQAQRLGQVRGRAIARS